MGMSVGDAAASKPFLVISDVHLGAVPAGTERLVRDFLDFAAASSSGLLINGDLFDVWIASRHFVVRRHIRVLAKLADVVEAGVPVYFVGGNHDAIEWGGEMLRDDLGITLLDEPARIVVAGRRALVVHGDGVRPGSTEYRKRHPVLRSRAFRWLSQRVLHLDRIADAVGATSGTPRLVARRQRGDGLDPTPAAALLESWARATLSRTRDVDLVIAGHSHHPALVEVEPGRFYLNTGDWISHMTYGILAAGGSPEIRRWPDQTPVFSLPSRTLASANSGSGAP